jgi:putative restriction endonuclease
MNWTRPQLILALDFYCRTPFGKLHKGNPAIIQLAKVVGRTPDALAMKLVNFASFDPALQARGIKGSGKVSSGLT